MAGYGQVPLEDSSLVAELRARVAVLESRLAKVAGEVLW